MKVTQGAEPVSEKNENQHDITNRPFYSCRLSDQASE